MTCGTSPRESVGARRETGGRRRSRLPWLLVVAVLATCATASGSARADSRISAKEAQARAVLAQIQVVQGQVEQAGNAYYRATQQLKRIDGDLGLNMHRLLVARSGLRVARAHIAARLRALYVNGGDGGALEILLGARSVDDVVSGLDAAHRVSRQDVEVAHEVTTFQREVAKRQQNLLRARTAQARLVAERAAETRSIQDRLASQQRLLSSVREEVGKLRVEEARRQALLAAQARARYVAALQAQQQEALAAENPIPSLGIPSIGGVPPPAKYGSVVAVALQYLGTPYVWGASGPGAFDCSGLTAFVYAQVGVYLPHNAAAQYSYGVPVARDQLEPGDLVFFDSLGHVGLYIGNDEFVQAPQTGDVVKITSLDDPWVLSHYYGARRIV